MDSTVQQSWENFLNPDLMRHRLISASIYIAGYESLKDAIIDRIRYFFWNGFDQTGDKIDPEYQSSVLSRNKSPLYASLDWLKHMNAIDNEDIASFDRIKNCRNVLAHRLFATLSSEGLPSNFEKCFHEMVSLLRKVEVWWIKEVEITTDPDFDGQEIDEDDIQPGRVLGLQLLCDIALGDAERSRLYFDEFQRRAGTDNLHDVAIGIGDTSLEQQ